jgi:RHS repeat-associated protein
MAEREITREPYRHGYQGQFAEKDGETGWNAFELRMYDARIGRTTTTDPYGQFDSPYMWVGNNPTTNTDPDGGFCCESIMLEAVTVTAKRLPGIGSTLGALVTSFTSNLTPQQYQVKYPEFKGMTQEQMVDHWERNYSDKFYERAAEQIRIEKINAAQAKLNHFSAFFGGALFVSGGGGRGVTLRSSRGGPSIRVTTTAPKVVSVDYGGKQVSVYRGGKSFTLKPGEYKVNPETGLVKTTHGASLEVNSGTASKFGGAYKLQSLPKGLKIIQRGQRPEHFEIVPEYEMPVETFQSLLNQIKTIPLN